MTPFLGIFREPVCSPGRHLENDAAILELVAGELEARGHRVALATADDAPRFAGNAPVVFSMSRSPAALDLLARWSHEGRTVVNAPASVLATARSRLAGRALGAVALPAAHVVPTARALRAHVGPQVGPSIRRGDWWVKGGDLYASRREDVQQVTTMQALERVLDDFERRGVSTAVLQEHVPGREIKFYAVGSADFFHWQDTNHPSANGAAEDVFLNPATAAGTTLALEIFGGDIVIDDGGRVTLIDLNDWPSFAPCREPAAFAIARYLEARLIAACAAASPAGSVTPSASA
jgi:hypothetical protein